jgi:soluble lytic murein transglycosylase-like protein
VTPATPSLPPYAHITAEAVQCIADASVRYRVPELLLHAVVRKENGRMGKAVRNKNGSYDMGLAQINTTWVAHFAKYGIRIEHLLYNTCTNLQASAYILRDNANKFNEDWFKAIIAYNIGPSKWDADRYAIGYRYASDVVGYWWGFQNWVDAQQGVQRQQVPSYVAAHPYQPRQAASQAEQIVSTPPTVELNPESSVGNN